MKKLGTGRPKRGQPDHSLPLVRPNRNTERVRVISITLDPTPSQTQQLYSHVGAVRYTYNWCLSQIYAHFTARKQDPTLTLNTTAYGLRALFNQTKTNHAPWWGENSKEAYADGCTRAAKAFQDWRTGKTRPPKYHRRGSGNQSCLFTTGGFGVVDHVHVRVPKIGVLHTLEPTKRLRRVLAHGGRITQVRVVYRRCRWFADFTVREPLTVRMREPRVFGGADLGFKTLVSLVTDREDVEFVNPRVLRACLGELRACDRVLSRRVRGSRGYERARLRRARLFARVSNVRDDCAWKVARAVVGSCDVLGLESLNVRGMAQLFGRSVSDAGLAGLVDKVVCKAGERGVRVIRVDRWYPSSKTCSSCGLVKAKLGLGERVFECECGVLVGRDWNAGNNLRLCARDVLVAEGLVPLVARVQVLDSLVVERGECGLRVTSVLRSQPSFGGVSAGNCALDS